MVSDLIYKFRHFDHCGHHLRLLSRGELYFAKPKQFNDPFDCFTTLRFDLATEAELIPEYVAQARRYKPDITDEEAQEWAEQEYAREGPESRFDHQHNIRLSREGMDERWRVCTLSADWRSLLMWSHYSDNHRGFCVGFDHKRLCQQLYAEGKSSPFRDFPVSYRDNPPLSVPGRTEHVEAVYRGLNVKHLGWAYEQEHRIVALDLQDPVYSVDPATISEVTLGCQCNESDRARVFEALDVSGASPVVYQALMRHDSYSLYREQLSRQSA